MLKAISLALTVVIGSPEDVVGQVRRGRRRDHAPLHQRARRSAGAQTVVRAGVGPGDEAVERDRDVSDDSSHARADPIRRPNSSLTQAVCSAHPGHPRAAPAPRFPESDISFVLRFREWLPVLWRAAYF